ncbi:MAG: tetraacyldisaccharide 4'-kinase, partial [Pseudomonadota bacterium]
HHRFSPDDFSALAGVIVMTEKDAVKCAGIAGIDAWYLEIEAQLPAAFLPQLLRCTNLDSEGRA